MKLFIVFILTFIMSFAQADDFLRKVELDTLTSVFGKEFVLDSITAIYIQGNGCPIARLGNQAFEETALKFPEVEFIMLNSFIQDDEDSIRREIAEFDLSLPVFKDKDQSIAKALGVERTAEVFLLDASGQVLFRGPVNDSLGYETQKEAAINYLENAILEGGIVDHSNIPESKGCLVALF